MEPKTKREDKVTSYKFTIPLEPIGKGRPRVTARGGFARAYTPTKTRDWEKDAAVYLAEKFRGARSISQPCRVDVSAYFQRPKSHKLSEVWHTTKPDKDNIDKAVFDSMVAAEMLTDDKLIADGRTSKLYTPGYGTPGYVSITLTVFD